MSRNVRGIPRALGIVGVFIATLMFSSCLELETNLRLAKDGGVSADITYIFSENPAAFGRGFGSDEPWPLPLTEKDFRQQQLRHPGVELKSYRRRTRRDGSEEIEIRLKSNDLETLASYLAMDIRLEGTVKNGVFIMEIPDMSSIADNTDAAREALEHVTDGMVFRFRFRPPSRPTESRNGIIDGRYASVDISMQDLLAGEAPAVWSVSW